MNLKKSYILIIFFVSILLLYFLNFHDSKNSTTVSLIKRNKAPNQNLSQIETIANIKTESDSSAAQSEPDDSKSDLEDTEIETKYSNILVLKNAVATQDVCELDRNLFSIQDISSVLLNSGLKTKNDDLLQELIETQSAILKGNNPTDGKHPIVRFYYALYLADLISGVETDNQKYNQANDILSDLQIEHPENGAYPYMRALVLEKMNAPTDDLKKEFLKAFFAPQFDLHVQIISKTLFVKSLSNPVELIAGFSTTAQLPIPNSVDGIKLIGQLIKQNDLAFNMAAESFAQKRTDLSRINKGSLEFIDWSILDVVIGTSVQKHLHKTRFPNDPKLVTLTPSEIIKQIAPNSKKLEQFFEVVQSDCSSDKLKTLFLEFKNEYLKDHPLK